MKSFLEHVAEDILAKYGENLSRIAIVFPNKRAALFLNECLARMANKPIWSPAYITISELFRSHSSRKLADNIKLVCDLHQSFTAQTGIDETLDHFYGWGQVLLSDFDDIDKQMADADQVFSNLSGIHQMDDDSFLTNEQRQVLKRFFSNFSDDHYSELRQRFLRLWSRMGDIYHDFNSRLEAQSLAYEGSLYREVVSNDDTIFRYDIYLFVGFNVLLNVEKRLFTILHRQGKARFYWDFDQYYMKNSAHEAGHFISQHLAEFPNELDSHDQAIYDNFRQNRSITIVSASTENIQARYAAEWLGGNTRISDGRHTAIVLCNEGLLPVITHCLPAEVKSVNITTGFPLAQSPVANLVNRLMSLRRDGFDNQRSAYRLRQVNAVLSHPYLTNTSPQVSTLRQQLNEEKNYFPTPDQLAVDKLTTLIFAPSAHSSITNQPSSFNEEMLVWLCQVIQAIHPSSLTTRHSPFTEETIFRTYTLLNRLLNLIKSGDLTTDIITLGRLVNQLMQQTTVPFHGEPVNGLQVMGVLETRNLDFDHVLMLSASEGNIPKGTSDTSFIPYSLRKAYGLTTADHKVAIYSYYFHRLLQRASDITLVYNNATSEGQKGEMSRFLLQLMVECPHPISFLTLQGGQDHTPRQPRPVENHAQLPPQLSPTAITRYMQCPLSFHYHYVCKLKEPDEQNDDAIDSRLFGNIFHEAARILYSRFGEKVSASDINALLKSQVDIERAADHAICQELFHNQSSTIHHRPLDGLQIINREVIIHYLRQLLTIDLKLTPFTILKLEEDVSTELTVTIRGEQKKVVIGGRIDRLDKITDSEGRERIRVIDYKTAAQRMTPLTDVEAIFSQENRKKESDYYLQTMLYSLIVARQHPDTPVSPGVISIQHASSDNYDPTLLFGKEPIVDVTVHSELFTTLLENVIATMYDHNVPLTPTTDQGQCKKCPYRLLCY